VEKRWKIASIGGVPIYITIPWLFFAAFVVWATYTGLAASEALTNRQALGWSAVNASLFYAGIVLHELAHAVTARGFGLHVMGITLVFWGGYTEVHSNERGPLAAFLIAAAGPFTTLVLAGIFWVGAESTTGVLSVILDKLAFLSLLFAALNALPGFPVDGGRMLLAVVWAVTHNRYTALRIAGWGGVVVGAVLGFVGLQLLFGGNDDGIFFAFIGWMMVGQGIQVTKQAPLLRDLSGGQVSEVMTPPPPPISSESTLMQVLDSHLREDRRTEFPVVDPQGRVVGSLSFANAAKIGRRDPMKPVREAMTPKERMRTVTPDLSLDGALERMSGSGQALVLDGDRVVGRLTAGGIDRWYRRRVLNAGSDDRETVPPRPDLG
jgi:Zn-dependent protease